MVVFTCDFGDKNLKTCGGIHRNTGFFGGDLPSANSTKKNPVPMKPPRFQVLTPNSHVKPSFFSPSFTETVNKKKRAVSP